MSDVSCEWIRINELQQWLILSIPDIRTPGKFESSESFSWTSFYDYWCYLVEANAFEGLALQSLIDCYMYSHHRLLYQEIKIPHDYNDYDDEDHWLYHNLIKYKYISLFHTSSIECNNTVTL